MEKKEREANSASRPTANTISITSSSSPPPSSSSPSPSSSLSSSSSSTTSPPPSPPSPSISRSSIASSASSRSSAASSIFSLPAIHVAKPALARCLRPIAPTADDHVVILDCRASSCSNTIITATTTPFSTPRHSLDSTALSILPSDKALKTDGSSLLPDCVHLSFARPRSLSANATIHQVILTLDDEMNVLAGEPPASPPGLTASKSSKASTNRSSSLSDDAILSDITHFEDIGLDDPDDVHPTALGLGVASSAPACAPTYLHTNPTSHGMDASRRSQPRAASSSSATTTAAPVTAGAKAVPTQSRDNKARDLTKQAQQPAYPFVPEAVRGNRGAIQSLGPPHLNNHHYHNPSARQNHAPSQPIHHQPLPRQHHLAHHPHHHPVGFGPMRKMTRNASTPSLAITAMSNYNRSRSPSPNPGAAPFGRPLPSPRLRTRKIEGPKKDQQIPIRRGSWQPNRKSVKELEAECNDEDDDLPDDASLWNVPLSPRPGVDRTPSLNAPSPRPSDDQGPPANLSAVASPRISPSASPERPSPLRTSVGSDGTVSGPPPPDRSPQTPDHFQSPPRLQHALTTSILPDYNGVPRSKSWNAALSELSEEAKALTATLEDHALAENRRESAPPSQSGPDTLHRSKTASSVELPPLRVNNIMIDPLPISKEKEKVLSRTRPSWLPPKSKSEERKHLREYAKMMEWSREAEKRKAARAMSSRCAKDSTQSALLRIWEEHVLPHWDDVIREPRTRELWWRGVAPKSRAQVWSKAIGNDLALTENTYSKALQRAEHTSRSSDDNHKREKAWFAAIETDILTTMPDLHIFQPSGPLHQPLANLLKAYAMYRSDVGYTAGSGTHLIAAFLLLHLPSPGEAFIALANLLNRPLPLAFLTRDPAGMRKAHNLALGLLSKKYPTLHAHLFTSETGLKLRPEEVLDPLFSSMLLSSPPSLDCAARAWDIIMFDGDFALIRSAVAVLGSLEARLYGTREEILAVLQGGKEEVDDEEAFVLRVRDVGRLPSVKKAEGAKGEDRESVEKDEQEQEQEQA